MRMAAARPANLAVDKQGKSRQEPHGGVAGGHVRRYRMFTARAARMAMVASDMDACSIIRILAQRESTGTSVGEKAVLVLKARNR